MTDITPEGSVSPVFLDRTPQPPVVDPDLTVDSPTVQSPDGTAWALSVDDDGNVQANPVSGN